MRTGIIFILAALLFLPSFAFADVSDQCSSPYADCICITTEPGVWSSSQASIAACASSCETVQGANPHITGYQVQCIGTGQTIAQATFPTAAETAAAAPVPEKTFPVLNLNVQIPGLSFTEPSLIDGKVVSNYIGEYISAIYKLLLSLGAVIAVVLLMVGGMQWILAAGNAAQVSKAKKRIEDAITGVVLLLFAVTIAEVIDPGLTTFDSLEIVAIPEIPFENQFEAIGSEAIACAGAPADLKGVNRFQDCALNAYGDSESAVSAKLVNVEYKGRTYRIHELAAEDFKKALEAIDASGVNYNITQDLSGGTFNWRCNKNAPNALSPHSFGIAIDINPNKNPNCPSGCTDRNPITSCSCVWEPACVQQCAEGSYDLPPEVINAFKSNGFQWGGDWTRVKDYMHFTYAKQCPGG